MYAVNLIRNFMMSLREKHISRSSNHVPLLDRISSYILLLIANAHRNTMLGSCIVYVVCVPGCGHLSMDLKE